MACLWISFQAALHAPEFFKRVPAQVVLLAVGRMHDDGQQPGHRIDDQVSFVSGDFLATVVSARADCFRGPGRWTVDDRRGGRAFSTRLKPRLVPQMVVDPLPDSRGGAVAEEAVDRTPVRKVQRQIALHSPYDR